MRKRVFRAFGDDLVERHDRAFRLAGRQHRKPATEQGGEVVGIPFERAVEIRRRFGGTTLEQQRDAALGERASVFFGASAIAWSNCASALSLCPCSRKITPRPTIASTSLGLRASARSYSASALSRSPLFLNTRARPAIAAELFGSSA